MAFDESVVVAFDESVVPFVGLAVVVFNPAPARTVVEVDCIVNVVVGLVVVPAPDVGLVGFVYFRYHEIRF